MATIDSPQPADGPEALAAVEAARTRLTALARVSPPPDSAEAGAAFEAWSGALATLETRVRHDLIAWSTLPQAIRWDLLAGARWREFFRVATAADALLPLWRAWATGEVSAPSAADLSVLRGNLLNLFASAVRDSLLTWEDSTTVEETRLLAERGIAHAEAFLEAGETAAGVREQALRLYANAGVNEAERGDRAAAPAALNRRGLDRAEAFLEAGETAAGVREQALWLYANAGVNEAERGDRAAAAALNRRGLDRAEAFLEAGETAAGVREQALWLYANAGFNEAERDDRAAAAALYRRGLDRAEAFLEAGETAAGVREQALWLYANAGFNEAERDDRAAAAALYRRGLDRAEAFLEAGETAAGVREQALWLYANAGFNEAERDDRAAAAALNRRGLDRAEAFLEAGETAAGVREQALRLYVNAGVNENRRDDRAAAAALYRRGLDRAEAFLEAGETAAGVREQALWLYANAGFNEAERDDRAAAAALNRRGLDRAEAFLEAGETAAGVREQALWLYANAGFNEAERDDRAAAAALNRRGLDRAEAFLEAGETAAGVREQALRLYVNAGFNENRRDDRAAAAALNRRGLDRAEAFLEAGETAAGVREQALWLYANAGFNEAERGDRAAAAALNRRGLDRAEAFLEAGETAAGVREQALRLYVNAGFNENRRDDRAAAAALNRRGLDRAEAFLEAGETAAGVREQALWLYANAGFNEAERDDRAAAAALNRRGLDRAEAFLEAGETAAGVREQALRLYVNAGFNEAERGDRAAAAALNRRGLDRAEAFLEAGETAAGVREQALRLYVNAGANENRRDDRAAAAALNRRGLDRAEAFLEAGETAAGVREQALRLYANAGVNAFNRGLIHDARRYELIYRMLYGIWGFTRKTLNVPVTDTLRTLPDDAILPLWTSVVHAWLLHYHALRIDHLAHHELDTLLRAAEAALLLDQAEQNRRFRGLFDGLRGFQEAIQTACDARAAARHAAQQSLRNALRPLQLLVPASPDVEDCAAIQNALDRQPWWKRRLWPNYRRARQALRGYHTQLATPPRLADPQQPWKQIERGQQALADWLVERLRAAGHLPATLNDHAQVALAVLLAGQPDPPAATVARWRTQPPWDDPATLTAALDRTGWREWLPEPGDTTRKAMYAWTMRQPHERRLRIEERQLNDPDHELQTVLIAFRDHGDSDPLRTWLAAAWQQAQPAAEAVGRLLQALAQHQKTDAPPDLKAALQNDAAPAAAPFAAAALAAVALGDVEAVLGQAVRDWLDRHLPLDRDNLELTLQRLKQRFARVLNADPGPPEATALQRRLHDWSRAALGRELAKPHPDPNALWAHLERGRIALTGLAVSAPDDEWKTTTAQALNAAIRAHLDADPRPGATWPPLAVWLQRTAAALPTAPDAAACQQRLKPAEALAQLFFDPNTGRLQALWLTPRASLTRRAFPDAAQADRWRGRDGILERWARWAEDGELESGFPAVFEAFAASEPARTFADALRSWAAETGYRHLVLLLPAELAQMPWEALDGFDPERLTLERPVHLAGWRGNGHPPPRTEPRAHIAWGADVGYGPEEAAAASAYWRSLAPQADDEARAFDVMAGLDTRAHSHLILHGRYDPLDPRASHLIVGDAERIFAWTLAALNLRGHVALSACQAGLHGRAANERRWLGSVGLGPALLAAGARRVIAPLWRCNQVATWLFHELLYEAAAEQPGVSWPRLLARARERLRALPLADIEARLRQRRGENYRAADFLAWQEQDPPFANPVHWAGFVLLGEGDPWPDPASAADARVGTRP